MPDVQVRIAVAVDEQGNWHAAGSSNYSGGRDAAMVWVDGELVEPTARYWLTATLPVPEAQTVRAEVTDAKE